MIMRHLRLVLTLLLLLGGSALHAEDLLMARVPMSFPETMLKLQSVLKENKLTLSRVQRVDIGLTKSGYKTDKYRIVFFARPEEIKTIPDKYPQLIPYLPHKIAIFAEEDETLLVAANPELLFQTDDKELRAIVRRWHEDLTKIFHAMREE